MIEVIEVIESATFKRWIHELRDRAAVARINARLRNVSLGNFGVGVTKAANNVTSNVPSVWQWTGGRRV